MTDKNFEKDINNTSKQIIIDGCDVSGCEFYNKDDKTCREVNGKNDTDICDFDKCEGSNCLYKQLKRKEKECVELKDEILHLRKDGNKSCAYCADLIAKEQERERLEEDVERWKRNFNGKVSAIEELIKIIQQALEDFSIEVGTPQYDRLLNSAKSLGIGVKDYE